MTFNSITTPPPGAPCVIHGCKESAIAQVSPGFKFCESHFDKYLEHRGARSLAASGAPGVRVPMQVEDLELMPTRAYEDDAGLDLRSAEDAYIPVGQKRKVSTGVRVNIPAGYVGYVHVRSSLGFKHGVQLANGTGVIDAGFTGVIQASLINHGKNPVRIARTQKIMQLVIHKLPPVDFVLVDAHEDTARGTAGIGSTGSK